MRIITWNVNGLRSVLSKGHLDWALQQDADILCLQEIKSRPDQVDNATNEYFSTWNAHWNPAQRPGYSGVLNLSRKVSAFSSNGLGFEEFDTEGRVIQAEMDGFTLYNIYFPNGQRDQGRLDYKLRFYAHLLQICDRQHAAGKRIIICGDFNTAHRPIDLRNPKQNEKNSGFLPEERAWIDLYLEHGFVDVYRCLYPELVQYTWWTYIGNARARNVGWRLDYFLVSQNLMSRIQDTVIHDNIPGSDHCPVSLYLR